jgi:acetylornithine/succinyldiaminopimelate/putrescine aminotransferase/predicted amino acid dehydrogenase
MNNQELSPYAQWCKPKLDDMLECMGLDREYIRASGDHLVYLRKGKEVPVLDFVGGFGTTLLGHNNPELKAEAVRLIGEDTPFAAQCARRNAAARLARKLSSLVPGGGRYYTSFSSTGAEAVEAAIKHAYMVHFDKARRRLEEISRALNDFYHAAADSPVEVSLPDSSRGRTLNEFRDDIDEFNLGQFEKLQKSPVICALTGSFHGKTMSALKVTSSRTYREPFEGLSAIQASFMDPADPEKLQELVTDNSVEFLLPRVSEGRVILETERRTRVVALILEVVLGEGGILPVPDGALQTLARLHESLGVPFIIDEIQTGCGRTGSFFACGATPLRSIQPEYLTLSKALGGGLSKIAATLIRADVYDPDFGILHTSTFAEDELSSALALKSVEILTRHNGSLMKGIAEKGQLLLRKLETLRKKYPQIVSETRGRGLMLAIELSPLEGASPFFRFASRQGFLSLLVASYLLNRHNVRIFAPLSTLMKGDPGKRKPSVIRIEPSAFITEASMEILVSALDEAFQIIECNNEFCMVAHLVEAGATAGDLTHPARLGVNRPVPQRRQDFNARAGFLMHPTSLAQLIEYYFPSFTSREYDPFPLEQWWNRLSRYLEPDCVDVSYVAADGFVVENNMIAVPYLSHHLADAMNNDRRSPDRSTRLAMKEIRDKIQDAVTVARDIGGRQVPMSMVGLGAYTSIVTDNGKSLNDDEVPLTTGNAFTSALMFMGILKAAEITGIDLSKARAAVVGGAGNIGVVLASLLCGTMKHVAIVGRPEGGTARLEAARLQCLADLLEEIREEEAAGLGRDGTKIGGLKKEIYDSFIDRGPAPAGPGDLDARIRAFRGVDSNPFISVHTRLDILKECQVVAIATNSPNRNLITPRNTRKGSIICCASIPSNLSETFARHMDEYFVFDGGFARLPSGSSVEFVGMPGNGLAFGCLSETLLLALDGRNHSFAKGPLTISQVKETIGLAERFGFSLGEFKLGESIRRV